LKPPISYLFIKLGIFALKDQIKKKKNADESPQKSATIGRGMNVASAAGEQRCCQRDE
jgi:hypothetical protein